MKVSLGTIEVDDDVRRAVNDFLGKPGLATRETIRSVYLRCADADLNEIVSTWRQNQEDIAEPRT